MVERLVALVTGIAAVFAAMNTMYRIVASGTREIGTLRALGFSHRAILLSFVVESALVGLLAASMLHGHATSTSNLQSFSELASSDRPSVSGNEGGRQGSVEEHQPEPLNAVHAPAKAG